MTELVGRRRPDLAFDELHTDLRPGDYWKILNAGDGQPRQSDCPENLTGTCWYVVAPMEPAPYDEGGFGLGRLEKHTVREHDDGTISVRPGDGSSNSILITGSHGRSWHGFIEHDVWRTA